MDLSAAAVKEATWVGVQYHSSIDHNATWRTAKATKTIGAPAGMTRYKFQMSSYTLSPSASGTSLSRRASRSGVFQVGEGRPDVRSQQDPRGLRQLRALQRLEPPR